jgi:hypothetical protein
MRRFLVVLTALLLAVAGISTVAILGSGFEEPNRNPNNDSAELPFTGEPPPAPSHPLDAVLQRFNSEILTIPGVEGTGHTLTPAGDDAIQVWIRDGSAAERIPSTFEGYPVTIEIVPGGFYAQ